MEEIEFKLSPENCPHKWEYHHTILSTTKYCKYCDAFEVMPPCGIPSEIKKC